MFEVHDEELVEHLIFNIDDVYPGMPNFTDYATVSNGGDCDGKLSFKIASIAIMGEKYVVDNMEYTHEDIMNMLVNDYPFKIEMSLTNDIVAPNSEESFVINVSWPYESGDDALDTLWGGKAYEYHANNPDKSSIEIDVLLEVTQSTTDGS